MRRILAGIACFLLLTTGVVLMWRGSAEGVPTPTAPAPRFAAAVPTPSLPTTLAPIGEAPSADPKSKEEKRLRAGGQE